MKILYRHLKGFVEFARVRNIPAKEIFAVMRRPPADLEDPAAVIDGKDFCRAVAFIAETLGDGTLGLRVGDFVNLVHLGAVYQLSLRSTSVEEVLFYCRDYLRQTLSIVSISATTSGRFSTVALSMDEERSSAGRIILEHMLTLMAREIRVITGDDGRIKVYSPFYKEGYPASWRAGKQFKIVFSGAVLKAALKDNSHWGFDVLVPAYLGIMESLDAESSFVNKVKLSLLNMADPCLPDLERVADAFNMTPRTLQRRLAEENTTFREISEVLKRKICDLLIMHERYSILDISQILGYSEAAAFIHSFKKWHGASPGRRRAMAG
jgi:AraC-like DNA-binding protein